MTDIHIMENPKVSMSVADIPNQLKFTLSGVDVSIANGIRRTILSNIPTYVFKTNPHNENKCVITINTSRFNNEIIKQRLSCIPICQMDLNLKLEEFILEVEMENDTDTVMYVTTEHFKLKHKTTGTYLDTNEVQKIFPPYTPPTGKSLYYIDFLRLNPKVSEELPGERIKLTCEFIKSSAKDDSSFNVVGCCSYGRTPDIEEIERKSILLENKLKEEGKTSEDIEFEVINWKRLEGLRNVVKDSFDFILESIDVYDCDTIMQVACYVLSKQLENLSLAAEKGVIDMEQATTTIHNCYDVILENDDYTVGHIIHHIIYTVYMQNLKQLNYCGFEKMHPHDSHSILRLGFINPAASKSDINNMISTAALTALEVLKKISSNFAVKKSSINVDNL